jgi:hypothetical protein
LIFMYIFKTQVNYTKIKSKRDFTNKISKSEINIL